MNEEISSRKLIGIILVFVVMASVTAGLYEYLYDVHETTTRMFVGAAFVITLPMILIDCGGSIFYKVANYVLGVRNSTQPILPPIKYLPAEEIGTGTVKIPDTTDQR